MADGQSSPETPTIEKPLVTLTETKVTSPAEAMSKKQTGVEKFLGELRDGWKGILKEVTGKSTPHTEVVKNPKPTTTEVPVPTEGSITDGTALTKPQGLSEPKTEMITNPPVSPTETQIPTGYTEVGITTSQTTQTGISAGGNTLPNVILPSSPGPVAPPLQ